MTGVGASLAGTRARAALSSSRFGDVRWTPSTGSTNSDLLALARQGAPEGVVLVADHQTAGRGRLDRRWEAPAGSSLLASILLRPTVAAERLGLVTMALGVSAVDAIVDLTGADVGLKWPNDLVAEGPGEGADAPGATRKLAGMLAEGDGPGGALVVGIGINVAWGATDPPGIAEGATALDRLTDVEVDRVVLLTRLLRHLDHRYDGLLAGDTGSILDAYRERSRTIGARVRVDLGDAEVVGVACDVTAGGALVVDVPGSGRRTVLVGDVVHLRPVD